MFIMGNYKKCIILNISSLLPYTWHTINVLYYLSITLSIYLSKKNLQPTISTSIWCHTLLPRDCTVYNFPIFFFFAKPLFILVFVNWPVKEMLHSVRKYLLTYLECFLNQKMGKNSTMSTTSFENKILKSGKLGNFKKLIFNFICATTTRIFLKISLVSLKK